MALDRRGFLKAVGAGAALAALPGVVLAADSGGHPLKNKTPTTHGALHQWVDSSDHWVLMTAISRAAPGGTIFLHTCERHRFYDEIHIPAGLDGLQINAYGAGEVVLTSPITCHSRDVHITGLNVIFTHAEAIAMVPVGCLLEIADSSFSCDGDGLNADFSRR